GRGLLKSVLLVFGRGLDTRHHGRYVVIRRRYVQEQFAHRTHSCLRTPLVFLRGNRLRQLRIFLLQVLQIHERLSFHVVARSCLVHSRGCLRLVFGLVFFRRDRGCRTRHCGGDGDHHHLLHIRSPFVHPSVRPVYRDVRCFPRALPDFLAKDGEL